MDNDYLQSDYQLRKILLLVDYKGFFGSKQKTKVYRGGMDIALLKKYFAFYSYNVEVSTFSSLNFKTLLEENPIVIYTSSEDNNSKYKSYIEDIIYHIENLGILIIPRFHYLRSHNNKVSMELLREFRQDMPINTIHTRYFGTYEELAGLSFDFDYPVVIKASSGAMSKGVFKAESRSELLRNAKKISKSSSLKHDLWELLRKFKYQKKYKIESFNRNKYVVQNFIDGLKNDWKILVYGEKYFVLYRKNRKNDFRASGSGNFEFLKSFPEGMLDYSTQIKKAFNVPHISLDVGFDGKTFHLIEFQFLYFGTTTLEKADFYFQKENDKWILKERKVVLEEEYVKSIVELIENKIN